MFEMKFFIVFALFAACLGRYSALIIVNSLLQSCHRLATAWAQNSLDMPCDVQDCDVGLSFNKLLCQCVTITKS